MTSKIKKILIAEDERPLARALELKLSNAGFKTTTAFDGEEALNFIKKDKFDLILLDLIMPNISGFDVLLKLKQENNKIPIIITSNLGQDDDLKKVHSFGIMKYFTKSNVGIAEIVNYIKDYFEKKPTLEPNNKKINNKK